MKTLIVVLGPTGVGKTELSLTLAEFFRCPIVNADSRQIYRGIPICTAAPTPAERERVPHYFVETLPLDAYYSAALYEKEALGVLCEQIFPLSDVAVLTGGSMLYIDALCNGIDDIPTIDADTRELLRRRYEEHGLDYLCQELRLVSPEDYARIDLRNTRRVIHALEVYYMTGRPYHTFLRGKRAERPFRIIKLGLNRPRAELFERINSRVDAMMHQGLMSEVESVYPLRHLNSLNTVGFKELFRVVSGEWELGFALDRMRKNTRVYAKKQLTWFTRDESIHWFHPDEVGSVMKMLETEIG